jgi:hypothetical protein
LDEEFVQIGGKFRYLWRAVDHEGGSRSGTLLKRAAPVSASPSNEPKVREIMTLLRRRGLLDGLDEAIFEPKLQAARCYVQGRFSPREWIVVLHELQALQQRPRSKSLDGLFSPIAAGLDATARPLGTLRHCDSLNEAAIPPSAAASTRAGQGAVRIGPERSGGLLAAGGYR